MVIAVYGPVQLIEHAGRWASLTVLLLSFGLLLRRGLLIFRRIPILNPRIRPVRPLLHLPVVLLDLLALLIAHRRRLVQDLRLEPFGARGLSGAAAAAREGAAL
jgi:hypothetical protein